MNVHANVNRLMLCVVATVAAASCSTAKFSSLAPAQEKPAQSNASAEPAKAGNGDFAQGKSGRAAKAAGESFLQPGKSLDLYVIMDKSNSLQLIVDNKGEVVEGTDPKCKRFDALLDLIDEIKKKLVAKENVRLTVITFGTDPKYANDRRFFFMGRPLTESVLNTVGSTDDLLSLSRDKISEIYRAGVCSDNTQKQFTHYASGIRELMKSKFALTALKKFDVETALFFSDGAANDPDETELKTSIEKLNANFPRRLWGIILGEASLNQNEDSLCILKNNQNKKMTAEECMTAVVGGDQSRILRAKSAADISSALVGLIANK